MVTTAEIEKAIKKYNEDQVARSKARIETIKKTQGYTRLTSSGTIEKVAPTSSSGSSGVSTTSTKTTSPEKTTSEELKTSSAFNDDSNSMSELNYTPAPPLNYTPVGKSTSPTVTQTITSSKNLVDPGLAYGIGSPELYAKATQSSPKEIAESQGLEYKTAEVKQRYGTREQITYYDDGRQVRTSVNPIAENVRQGGTVSFRTAVGGEGGRPQVSSFTVSPKATNVKLDQEGNVKSFDLKVNPEIKGKDKVLTESEGLTWYEKLIKSGEQDIQKGYKYGANQDYVIFPNIVGSTKKTIGYAGKTLSQPAPYIIVGGLTLLATKNPGLAHGLGTAGAVAFGFDAVQRLNYEGIEPKTYSIGGFNVYTVDRAEPEEIIGEFGAYAGLGAGASKISSSISTGVEQSSLKIVDSKGVSKSFTTSDRTVNFIEGGSRVKGTKTDFLIDSSSEIITPGEFKDLAVGKGTGKYTVRNLASEGKEIVDIGSFDLTTTGNEQLSKSIINIETGKGKQFRLIDETFSVKTDTGSRDLSLVYDANKLNNLNLIQGQTGVTENIYKTPVLSESGNLISLESSDYFVRTGLKKESGLKLFDTTVNKVGRKANLPKVTEIPNTFDTIFAKKLSGTSSDVVVGASSGNQKYLKVFESIGVPKTTVSQGVALEVAKANIKIESPTVITGGLKAVNIDKLTSKQTTKGGVTVTVPGLKPISEKKSSSKAVLSPITEPKPSTIISPEIKTSGKSGSSSRSRSGISSIIKPIVTTDQDIDSTTKTKQLQTIEPIIDTVQDQKAITSSVYKGSYDFGGEIITGINVPSPTLPSLSGGGGNRNYRYNRKARAPTTYNPTVFSIVTNYKSPKVNTRGLGVSSGLGLRPIKSSSKKKKKKDKLFNF